jgi:hypothetical protein
LRPSDAAARAKDGVRGRACGGWRRRGAPDLECRGRADLPPPPPIPPTPPPPAPIPKTAVSGRRQAIYEPRTLGQPSHPVRRGCSRPPPTLRIMARARCGEGERRRTSSSGGVTVRQRPSTARGPPSHSASLVTPQPRPSIGSANRLNRQSARSGINGPDLRCAMRRTGAAVRRRGAAHGLGGGECASSEGSRAWDLGLGVLEQAHEGPGHLLLHHLLAHRVAQLPSAPPPIRFISQLAPATPPSLPLNPEPGGLP